MQQSKLTTSMLMFRLAVTTYTYIYAYDQVMLKTKRTAYDVQFKLKVIILAEEKGHQKAAFELGIDRSIKTEITAGDSAANSSNSHCNSDVSMHAPLSDKDILILLCPDTEESDFSQASPLRRIKLLLDLR